MNELKRVYFPNDIETKSNKASIQWTTGSQIYRSNQKAIKTRKNYA